MDPTNQTPRLVGRYAVFDSFASGGMASVHLGRLMGQVGFVRTVAIKRLHDQFARDPEFVAMFLDEARLVARIRHPNVVPTLDVVALGQELFLVMEYVSGEALSFLLRRAREKNKPVPIAIVVDVMCNVLNGLHAAHEATDERGEPLNVIHRDVSPQNILVGVDGIARVLDFGVAKAVGRLQQTRAGEVKGKVRYMPPEQLRSQQVTRATDVYAASVVLWEALTGARLFAGATDPEVMYGVLNTVPAGPSTVRADVSAELDAIVLRGLAKDPAERFPTASAMARALESAVPPVTRSSVVDWVLDLAGDEIQTRARRVARVESELTPAPQDPAASSISPSSGRIVEGTSVSLNALTTSDADGRSARRLARSLSSPLRATLFAAAAAISTLVLVIVWIAWPKPSHPPTTFAGASAPTADRAPEPQVEPDMPPTSEAPVAPPAPLPSAEPARLASSAPAASPAPIPPSEPAPSATASPRKTRAPAAGAPLPVHSASPAPTNRIYRRD